MGISFDIKKNSDKRTKLKSEAIRFAEQIKNLKTELDWSLALYNSAIDNGNANKAKGYLLKIASVQSLLDAYNLCLKAIKMEMEGV